MGLFEQLSNNLNNIYYNIYTRFISEGAILDVHESLEKIQQGVLTSINTLQYYILRFFNQFLISIW